MGNCCSSSSEKKNVAVSFTDTNHSLFKKLNSTDLLRLLNSVFIQDQDLNNNLADELANDFECDHACYRCKTNEEYQEVCAFFENEKHHLSERAGSHTVWSYGRAYYRCVGRFTTTDLHPE